MKLRYFSAFLFIVILSSCSTTKTTTENNDSDIIPAQLDTIASVAYENFDEPGTHYKKCL